MNDQLWQRARELFEGALNRTPEEWSAFLDQQCRDDATLKSQVRRLLEGHRAAAGFLEPPIAENAATTPAAPRSASDVGRRIGPYRVVSRLASGGMGAVYLAVRADDEFKRRVALKLLKPDMDSDEVIRRFRTERQILAALDHPNVAKLFDGGTTRDGRPYLVMDYVEGRPIDEYCNAHNLSVEKRLELFCTVCSTVSHAHRNLVVHRDLKPSNILVTDAGRPKLLDFGIAKLLNPELSCETLAPTATAMRLMTPEYASPEQVRGERITTAADVYSLGVLLYKLLTGRLPHHVRNHSPHELVRAICDQVPEPPSTAVLRRRNAGDPSTDAAPRASGFSLDRAPRDVRRLHRRLSGDLDTIVLMALRKEPERRYDSADQLADDVRRHLAGQPVLARKDTLTYRWGKFVRRHRLGVAALTFLFAVVLGASIALGLQRRQIVEERDHVAAERDLAQQERHRAEQVTEFLIGLFEVSDPLETRDHGLDVRDVLDEGARRLATELHEQPETRAGLLETVGVIYQRLGLYDRAAALLDSALETRRQVHGDSHLSAAESLNLLAELQVERGQHLEARQTLQRALARITSWATA